MYYIIGKNGYIKGYVSYVDEENLDWYKEQVGAIAIVYSDINLDPDEYIYKNGQIVKLSESESAEKKAYGHILSDEERQTVEEEKQLAKLRPTREEVARAENQLMMLDMLEELKDE